MDDDDDDDVTHVDHKHRPTTSTATPPPPVNRALERLTHAAVQLVHDARARAHTVDGSGGGGAPTPTPTPPPPPPPIVVCGSLGPRGDGYRVERTMSVAAARAYHTAQLRTLVAARVDVVTAMTMTYVDEALGVVLAAADVRVPCVLSFTVERDGRLPSGDALSDAVRRVDAAASEAGARAPLFFMVNCAHPDHYRRALLDDDDDDGDGASCAGGASSSSAVAAAAASPAPTTTTSAASSAWRLRVRGVRSNASRKSHAELDECTELDAGDAGEFGLLHAALRARAPQLCVLGGCCGTSEAHIDAVCDALATR